jgi:phage shock protein A
MTSILERLDDLIRGSLHRFVDRALERNSLILYDQDVRDMGSAIDHLEEATTTMYAAARANERRLAQHQEDIEELERRLEALTAKGVEPTSERMMVAQAELAAKQGLVVETEVQIQRQQEQYETLSKKLAETRVVAQTLEDQRPRLESLLVLARAYRSVERVEMTLEALKGLGGDTEVAAVADSIYRRFGEAQARLEAIRQADDLELLAELEQVEVDDQLAARRRRLGLEPEPAEPVSANDDAVQTPPEPSPPKPPDPEPVPEEPTSPPDTNPDSPSSAA